EAAERTGRGGVAHNGPEAGRCGCANATRARAEVDWRKRGNSAESLGRERGKAGEETTCAGLLRGRIPVVNCGEPAATQRIRVGFGSGGGGLGGGGGQNPPDPPARPR